MKPVPQMNLLCYLPVPRMLAKERVMAEEMEIWEIEDVALIQVDKGEV